MVAGRRATARQKSMASRVMAGPFSPAPGAARGAGQGQLEVLTVTVGPLGDDIGDDHAVMIGGQTQRDPGGPGDVEAVHPRVAGQDDVDEVAEGPRLLGAVDVVELGHGAVADE